MTIGERIALKRIEKGWSQAELAKRMGYSDRSAIAMVETGRRDISQTNVIKYATILECTPSYLMGWDEPIDNGEQRLLEEVCSDEGMKKRLLAYAQKLKEILDAETS